MNMDDLKADGEAIIGKDVFAFLMHTMTQTRMERTPETFDVSLLDLDDDKIRLRRYMAIMANHLLRATLVGNPAPIVRRMSTRLLNPKVGDLVYESSSLWREDCWAKGIGLLEKITAHPERTFHIRYGPNTEDVTKWTNASIFVIPFDPMFVVPVGERDGTATTITREALIKAVNDQGWEFSPS